MQKDTDAQPAGKKEGMTNKIFLQYTKDQLDHNYDQRAWAKNADAVVARYVCRSAEARNALHCDVDIAYGPGADDRLDWFHTSKANAPVVIFIHAGAWRNFNKNDFSFVASSLVVSGCHVAILNFSKAPAVRVPAILDQVRSGIVWVYRNLGRFGADPSRVFVAGHSSGAYTTSMMLLTDWSRYGLPQQRIFSAAFCISGTYDLKPIILSSRGSYIHLEGDEEHDLSPIRHLRRANTQVMVAHCEGDTDEFQRHARDFAAALEQRGLLLECIRLPSINHFEIIEAFADSNSALHAKVLGHIARSV
jgi:arylformamidase